MPKITKLDNYFDSIVNKIQQDDIDFFSLLNNAYKKARRTNITAHFLVIREQEKNITDTVRKLIEALELKECLITISGGIFDSIAPVLLIKLFKNYNVDYEGIGSLETNSYGSFYHCITNVVFDKDNTLESIKLSEDALINKSYNDTSEARQARLKVAQKITKKIFSNVTLFNRNPDVAAETLFRANGICQNCKQPTPFKRKSNGQPYLEVHHTIPLSQEGEDVIENTIALCPNCHREKHYGI